tara:strand:- start:177 stop:338 length:162 start_codon:yes stop_codon:yes gene_type:complete
LEPPHLPPLGGLLVFLPCLQATLWLLVVQVAEPLAVAVEAVVRQVDLEQAHYL